MGARSCPSACPFLLGGDGGSDPLGILEQTNGKLGVRANRVRRVPEILEHMADMQVMGAVAFLDQAREDEGTGGSETSRGNVL